MLKLKYLLLAGTAALVFSSQSVLAQGYSPYSYYNYGSPGTYSPYSNSYGYGNQPNNYRSPYGYGSNYRYPYGYSNPAGNSSAYRYNTAPKSYATPPAAGGQKAYNYRSPYSANPGYANRAPNSYNYGRTPNYRSPYAYGYRPWYKKKKKDGIFDDGPFSGGDFAEELWPGDDSVWEDAFPVDGPWNRDWGIAPWNRDYADMYGDEGGFDKWIDFDDPKEGVAYMWEDFLYTPHALGTMPGGWDAPTVVVPNPIDVGDEFKDASADFPGEVKDFADGFTYGDRTVTGSKPKKDAGSFGLGNKKKKKDGINIEPKNRR